MIGCYLKLLSWISFDEGSLWLSRGDSSLKVLKQTFPKGLSESRIGGHHSLFQKASIDQIQNFIFLSFVSEAKDVFEQ